MLQISLVSLNTHPHNHNDDDDDRDRIKRDHANHENCRENINTTIIDGNGDVDDDGTQNDDNSNGTAKQKGELNGYHNDDDDEDDIKHEKRPQRKFEHRPVYIKGKNNEDNSDKNHYMGNETHTQKENNKNNNEKNNRLIAFHYARRPMSFVTKYAVAVT